MHQNDHTAGHLTCCKLVLEEGADIEQRNVMGETPLIRAAHNGHFQTVKFLVEHGADVNAVDMVGQCSLPATRYCCSSSSRPCVESPLMAVCCCPTCLTLVTVSA